MSCNSCGCCLGVIFGFVLALLILVAAGFGIYCYFNPEARNSSINVVENQWIRIKTGGDGLIEQSRNVGVSAPETKPKPAPEPQVVVPGKAPATGRPLPLTDPNAERR